MEAHTCAVTDGRSWTRVGCKCQLCCNGNSGAVHGGITTIVFGATHIPRMCHFRRAFASRHSEILRKGLVDCLTFKPIGRALCVLDAGLHVLTLVAPLVPCINAPSDGVVP